MNPAQFASIRQKVVRRRGCRHNLPKMVSKQDKTYFWDLGVRNAAIDNLKPLTERDDLCPIWENFVLAERLKWLHYPLDPGKISTSGARIPAPRSTSSRSDRAGSTPMSASGAGHGARVRVPESFLAAYPGASFEVITRESYRAYVSA